MASKVTNGAKRQLTELEWLVLNGIEKYGRVATGDRLIKYVSCARRLEKRGLCGKGLSWYITGAGKEALASYLSESTHRGG